MVVLFVAKVPIVPQVVEVVKLIFGDFCGGIEKMLYLCRRNQFEIMAVAGITVERTAKGNPTFVRIDLRKHANLIPILEENGVEIDEPIKWTAKMQRAFAEKEFKIGDINNFWDE